MKRFILTILLLLITSPAYPFGAAITAVAGAGGAAAGPVYTDCSQLGIYELYWNGDHATSNVTGCKSGGTITGTLTGAEIVASGTDPGTTSPTSGANVVKCNANDERLSFTVTAGDIFNSSEGEWCGDTYLAASTGNNYIFRVPIDGSNYIALYINSSGAVVSQHNGQNNIVDLTSTDTVSDTSWTRVCYRWSVANNKTSVLVGAGSWKDDADATSVTAFAAEPTSIRATCGNIQTDAVYIDNVTINTVSGW